MNLALWKNPFATTRRRAAAEPVELSENRLEKVIRAIAALESDADRASPRVRVRAAVTLLPFARGRTGEPRQVSIYDLSAAGVAVLDSRPMKPGTQFKLLIPRRLRRPIEVLCTARHCRQGEQGFIVGAEYGVSWLETLGTLVAPRPAVDIRTTEAAEIAAA